MATNKPITRRNFIEAAGTASAGLFLSTRGQAAAQQPKAGATKPNILFVFCDQLRYSALPCHGNKVVKTPNLDRMASQGIVFDNTFSSHPLCSPFRAQIMTGKYGFKNGVPDNEYKLRDDQVTLPQALKGAGYHTGFIGRWHLGYPPYPKEKRYGFDYLAGYNANVSYFSISYFENEKGPIKFDRWAPEGEADLAIKFMEDHQREKADSPFALTVFWGPPHWPYDQYPKEYKIYRPDRVDLPPNVPEEMVPFARRELADYYGNVTALDAQLGRLLKALDRLGLAEDTIVCLSADHGDHLSSHAYAKPMSTQFHHSKRASKGTPYEESAHIPFIMRYPRGVKAGQRSRAMVSSVDFMPTLLGLCGVEIPEGVQGHDLSHVATGEDGPATPDSVYLMNMGPGWPNRLKWTGFWRAVRTERWLYARWLNGEQGPFLFDCRKDPYQLNNLAGKKSHAKLQEDMEKLLKRWMAETEDPFETGKRHPKTGMLELGQEFDNKGHWKKWAGR